MHYYKLNIPEWNLHTAHLSLVEEAIYYRLVNLYYDTESPIPKETQPVFRRLRMADQSDIAEAILLEFFVLSDDGWHHKRCEKEISEYHEKADKNRKNGKNGGRPRKESLTEIPEITQSVSSGNPNITLTINQEPLTINQDIQANACTSESSESDFLAPCPHGEIIDRYNRILASQGLPAVNPKLWKGSRADALRARWREMPERQSLDWWDGFFAHVNNSDFLMGRAGGPRPFRADLEWLTKFSNFAKVCEGKYHG